MVGGTMVLSFQPFPNVTAMILNSYWLLSANTSQSWLELMIGRSDFIVLQRGLVKKSAEFERSPDFDIKNGK